MKFVRWLGAFGRASDLAESANWEVYQLERQVSAEPLWHGKSFIPNAKIGLEVAHPEATFARGWLTDSFTVLNDGGRMIATRQRHTEFKNMDKFLKVWNSKLRYSHGEATFSAPCYSSVACNKGVSPRGVRRAKRLAQSLNLPLRFL